MIKRLACVSAFVAFLTGALFTARMPKSKGHRLRRVYNLETGGTYVASANGLCVHNASQQTNAHAPYKINAIPKANIEKALQARYNDDPGINKIRARIAVRTGLIGPYLDAVLLVLNKGKFKDMGHLLR